MKLSSPAFEQNQPIPSEYTCDGANHHPPLMVSQVPKGAQSLVLVLEDPDAPKKGFTHWLLFDIPPSTREIPEQENPQSGTDGLNDFGALGYGGPCPPSGTHRYVFTLFALDTKLALAEGALKGEVLTKIQGHILDTAQVMGTYARR